MLESFTKRLFKLFEKKCKYRYIIYYSGFFEGGSPNIGFTHIARTSKGNFTLKQINEITKFCNEASSCGSVCITGIDYLGKMSDKYFEEDYNE